MKTTSNFDRFQPLIITAFWALLFASPLLFGRFEDEIDWDHIFMVWLNYVPLLVVFLINRYILLPKLFFKGKRVTYFISTTLLIGAITLGLFFFHTTNNNQQNRTPPPPARSAMDGTQQTPSEFSMNERPRMLPRQNKPDSIPPFANFLILAILLVGFDAGLQVSMRWASLDQEKMKLQTENIENQLAILKNQVSPHFFMNTLNNIHALVDIDSEEAKQAIIKLSNLMRHLLYDSEEKMTPIKKEVEFINSYVELMKLRFSNKVKISVQIPSEIPEKFIPPLLFTSLLENAFKHGISYNKDSFITIIMRFSQNKLHFEIENSNHSKITDENSGIGIENTKKRIALLFNNFDFTISENKEIYKVNLSIPL
ncbi:MAG: histidine kinase [Lutibacter sp.]|uniref:sensor histidine kinase n=1 Tax=Lutibacter sp. TaxID=1925666 RepID=UPI00184E2809|nr:histidine kinase [Lutibacter sp.]MBT8318192.1 histidine kinase [Lutibacter sp.]NNJ59052.1 histidine kinase [Lutibacter sp.]